MSRPLRAYSYIRISTSEQARGDGLRRQIKDADEWAKAKGYVIDQHLQDVGISAFDGSNRRNGALAKFIELVENGTVERGSVLIIESLDRLSRESVVHSLPDFLALLRAGVDIVTLYDQQIYSWDGLNGNPTPLYAGLGIMHRAHEESAMKSKRVSEAWTQKRLRAREGKEVLTSRVPGWVKVVGTGKARRLELDGSRAEIVRRIFHETAAGYGRRSIVIRLNEQKVPTFSGSGAWQPSYVAKIIRSRATIGEHQPFPRKSERAEPPIEGYFPAVVSKALFDRANAALDARMKGSAGRRGAGVANLLQGLAFCGRCGARMSLINKGAPPKGGRYLLCSDAARAAGCTHGRHWRLDLVERVVVEKMDAPAIVAALELNAEPKGPSERNLERAIVALRERMDNLLDLVEGGSEEAVRRFHIRQRELADLEMQLATIRETNSRSLSLPGLEERAQMMRELWSRMDGDADVREPVRRALAQHVREIWKSIRLTPHRITGVLEGLNARGAPIRPPRGVSGEVVKERAIVLHDDSPDGLAEEAWRHRDDHEPPSPYAHARLKRLLEGRGRISNAVQDRKLTD